MDIALFIALGIGSIILLALPIIFYLVFLEVKKIRKEMKEIKYSINKLNTSLLHHGSKLSLMVKHLSVIGSKLAPDSYRSKGSEKTR